MACCTSTSIHQTQLLPLSLCKSPFLYNTLNILYCSSHCLWLLPHPKHTPTHVLGTHVKSMSSKLSTLASKGSFSKTVNSRTSQESGSGFSSLKGRGERVGRKTVENHLGSIVEEKNEKRLTWEKNSRKEVGLGRRREMGSRSSVLKAREGLNSRGVNGQVEDKKRRGGDVELVKERSGKGAKKNKPDSPEVQLRVGLDMCSKRGDVMGAIQLYDLAQREGVEMGQYHYTVILYLCSSAALGVVQPAKSGSGTRVLNALDVSDEGSSVDLLGLSRLREVGNKSGGVTGIDFQYSNNLHKLMQNGSSGIVDPNELIDRMIERKEKLGSHFDENSKPNLQHPDEKILREKFNGSDDHVDREICVSEDFKNYALQKGFEIYEKMCLDAVPMNEATLTAVARMAMAMGNGDMAFDMVKQMKSLGINPKLRSYGPALSAFCSSGDVDKAFAVEKHMLELGVNPEEPELVALLRLSAEAGKDEKVYYLLHKLRASIRKVSPATADIIVRWFESESSSRVGKKRWNRKSIKEAIENRGGGWHGQGWLGKGRWTVSRASVGADALCRCCGEKLTIIDLDPVETENFAESVASIAIKRDRDSSFQKFQKWLDYYGPFEAVVDGANVGLFSQQRFMPSKINAIVNGMRHKLPSKRWPLIVLHNKRVIGNKMDQPMNKVLIEKWKNADALYATPTGSNDDWYWLYAAIKFKCLIVTNDEMRDHTFQLLGNDFFPRWKERHQVHFSFLDTGPVFHMPPPCSIVIQESDKGHWHVPIATDDGYEEETVWLCITRANSEVAMKDSTASRTQDSQPADLNTRQAMSIRQKGARMKLDEVTEGNQVDVSISPQEAYQNLRNMLPASVFRDHYTVLSKIEAAEKLGNYVIDFQI